MAGYFYTFTTVLCSGVVTMATLSFNCQVDLFEPLSCDPTYIIIYIYIYGLFWDKTSLILFYYLL